MIFEWNDNKNKGNKTKHGISFEAAALVFDDFFLLSVLDHQNGLEERWQSIGLINDVAIFVVHTVSETKHDQEEIIRIISARAATASEEQRYYTYRRHRQGN